MSSLIQKYNVPGPRYTSYPTVPFWKTEEFTKQLWIESFQKSFKESNQSEGISLYIHLPFCESLCTFCACHKHITKRHEVEEDYISTVLKEWNLYCNLVDEKPIIKEIHLGGGTPTFFAPDQLQRLIQGILSTSHLHKDYEFSFEGHPNNTTYTHLKTLYDLGFTRVSFGVQDYNEKVQKAIHRIQPFEQVQKVTQQAREIGYKSISHDLIFGLPHQTLEDVIYSIKKTKELQPDRISFYSYAHVPWVKGVGQRGFNENDLPKDEAKRELYEVGKQMLEEQGYLEVGMDHFALESDSLYQSMIDGKLHRNFMGYTSQKTQLMVGLGMSSISDSWYGFAQNVKTVKEYQAILNKGEIPVFRGHLLSDEDLKVRKAILDLMCQFSTDTSKLSQSIQMDADALSELKSDEIIQWKDKEVQILKSGRSFVRNVCMAFDQYLIKAQKKQQLFSLTV